MSTEAGELQTGYFYALAAAAIAPTVAQRWAEQPIEKSCFEPLGVNICFPLSVYPRVAVLLGLAATAVFLAFVLTEDRFAEAVADALIHGPVDRCLAIAIPYTFLDEHFPGLVAEDGFGSSAQSEGHDTPGPAPPTPTSQMMSADASHP